MILYFNIIQNVDSTMAQNPLCIHQRLVVEQKLFRIRYLTLIYQFSDKDSSTFIDNVCQCLFFLKNLYCVSVVAPTCMHC